MKRVLLLIAPILAALPVTAKGLGDMGASAVLASLEAYVERLKPFDGAGSVFPMEQALSICVARLYRYDAELGQSLTVRTMSLVETVAGTAQSPRDVGSVRQAIEDLDKKFRANALQLLSVEWRGCWAEHGWQEPLRGTADPSGTP
jgi:hypothetical protein